MISLILMTFIFYHMFYQTVKLKNYFSGKELKLFVRKHGLELEWCEGGVEGGPRAADCIVDGGAEGEQTLAYAGSKEPQPPSSLLLS